MCLAVPAQIVELSASQGVVDLHGNRIAISLLLTPEAQLGDWVLVHAGFAIQKLDAATAQETFAILADVEKAQASAPSHPPASSASLQTTGEVSHA